MSKLSPPLSYPIPTFPNSPGTHAQLSEMPEMYGCLFSRMCHPNLLVLSIHQGNGCKRLIYGLIHRNIQPSQFLGSCLIMRQCNKMTCPNCHTVSCYICRKVIHGYEHFSNVGGDFSPCRAASESQRVLATWSCFD